MPRVQMTSLPVPKGIRERVRACVTSLAASASKMCCIDLSSRRHSGSDSTGPGGPGTVLALKCPEHPLVALTNPSSAPSSPGADDAALVAFSALVRLALPASRLTSTASTVCFQGRAFFALAMKQRVLPPALPGARRPGCALTRCCSTPLNVPEELSGPARYSGSAAVHRKSCHSQSLVGSVFDEVPTR